MRCLNRLLFSGWLLFIPPVYSGGPLEIPLDLPRGTVLRGLPLDRWEYQRSFDTARECEKFKDYAPDGFKRAAEKETDPRSKELVLELAEQYSEGRCVSSDILEFIMKSERQEWKDSGMEEVQRLIWEERWEKRLKK
jgi:hypothetical protein